MHRLSGEFMARVMHVLEQCQAERLAPPAMAALLQPLLEGENVYVELPLPAPGSNAEPESARKVSKAALERLNVLLPWCTPAAVDADGLLGTLWSPTKPQPARLVSPAQAIRPVTGKASLAGQVVLDVGCFEGNHAIGFAERGARVWAIDGRIENVVKTLVRVWLAGLEHQVTVQWIDLESGALAAQLAHRGLKGSFDLVHLNHVLNHLSDPVASLRDCAALCHGSLYLNTHVESRADAQAKAAIELDGQRFSVRRHSEPTSPWEPFAGTVASSNWLTRESLLRLLNHLDFPRIDIRFDQQGANGQRIALMASRAAAAAPAAAPVDAVAAPSTPAPRLPTRFRKVLVVGLGRSGTSAVASMLKACGFFMGDDLDPVLHESVGLRALLKQRQHDEIDRLLGDWQAGHTHIAWKDPKLHAEGSGGTIDRLGDDWLLYAVFRDPVAVAQRRVVADGVAFEAAFTHTLASESRLRDFVQRTRKRVVPVSYERLMTAPLETLEELLSHLDLVGQDVPPVESIWAYMQERRQRYRIEQAMPAPGGPASRLRMTLAPDLQASRLE